MAGSPCGASAPRRRARGRAGMARSRAFGARARRRGVRTPGLGGARRRARGWATRISSCVRSLSWARRGHGRARGRGSCAPRRGDGGCDERRADEPRDVRGRLLHADARVRARGRLERPQQWSTGARRVRPHVRPRHAARLLPHVLRGRVRRQRSDRRRRGGARRGDPGADRGRPALALRPSGGEARGDPRAPGPPRRGGAACSSASRAIPTRLRAR